MVPQREAGIDFQQMQRARLVALEIELGDAGQPEPLDDVAAWPWTSATAVISSAVVWP